MINHNLVGGFNQPLWKIMELKSVGMIFPFPTEWKVIKIHVPNHQSEMASLNPSASVEPLSGKIHLFRGRTRGPYQSNVPDWSNGLCKNVIHCQPENGDTSFWTWCKLLRHLVANTFTKTNFVIKYRQFTLSIFTVKDIYLSHCKSIVYLIRYSIYVYIYISVGSLDSAVDPFYSTLFPSPRILERDLGIRVQIPMELILLI